MIVVGGTLDGGERTLLEEDDGGDRTMEMTAEVGTADLVVMARGRY